MPNSHPTERIGFFIGDFMKKLIYGVGVNDADYDVNPTKDGKRVTCHFYRKWYDMLTRCYSERFHKIRKTYVGCVVCDEWLTFSNFKKWMETQDWRGKELDKDIIAKGNKFYCPELCVFIDGLTNTFTIDSGSARGVWPIGVSFHKKRGRFSASCSNPFTKKLESLGYFDCELDAHAAWKRRKHELAQQLADTQTDGRVAKSLRCRYI